MAEVVTGRLEHSKKGNPMFRYTTTSGAQAEAHAGDVRFSKKLIKKFKQAKSLQVKALLTDGHVVWVGLEAEQPPDDPAPLRRKRGTSTRKQTAVKASKGAKAKNTAKFHNPYNFVPAPPRKLDGPLGDMHPAGHHRYHDDLWTGKIQVTLTTATPLLIVDASRSEQGDEDEEHEILPLRRDPDGNPRLAATAVKGMLRAAYEAVTNSRFESFEDDYVGYRLDFRTTPREMIPARVCCGATELELLEGAPAPSGDDTPLPAATIRMSTANTFEHGAPVTASISLWRRNVKGNVLVWNVDAVAPRGQTLPTGKATPPHDSRKYQEQPVATRTIDGYVYRTGRPPATPGLNPVRKLDERLFFTAAPSPPCIALTETLKGTWARIVREYSESSSRGRTRPPETPHHPRRKAQLKDGDLLYVRKVNGSYMSLHPVLVSRGTFPSKPNELLDPSLLPATSLDELSPADRVFGWVKGNGSDSYRGNLRVTKVTWRTGDVREFDKPGLPLEILSTSKTQQTRFYAAKDKDGRPHAKGTTREEAGYKSGNGLRGRKFYLTHTSLPHDYWTRHDDSREYVRPANRRDGQNKTITAWVTPESTFRFDIQLTNLSDVELGALLWLLDLPDAHCLRLGLGKPLGFGSVRLKIVESDLHRGSAWKQQFRLDESQGEDRERCCKAEFEKAVAEAYGQQSGGDKDPIIAAFLAISRGPADGLPIHYPRLQPQRDPHHPSYEWSVSNEQRARYSLPAATNDHGLPYDPTT